MKTFYWGAFYVALSLLLSACQTHTHKTSDVVVSAGNLAQYNLFLPYASASFDNQSLTIKGGIRNKTAPSHLACGYLDIQLFNKEGVLINTLTTHYSPCILHFRPKAKRTGHFSVSTSNIPPQPLTIKIFYRKK